MKPVRRLKLVTGRRALIRITESARRELEKLVFQRHPSREWGTFFKFGYRQTEWGLALSYVDALPPIGGDLDRRSGMVAFHTDYTERAVDALEEAPFGIGVIHSHPKGGAVSPSSLDDDMDEHFGTEMFYPFAPERPYASIILNKTSSGKLVFSGRVYYQGDWMPASAMLSAGERIERIPSQLSPWPNREESPHFQEILSRWLMVASMESVSSLKNATIGVIGCGGTGSPLIETLARAQVGGFVLVDPDRLSVSNLERVHGSMLVDIELDPPPYKVQLMARMIREINPDAEISLIAGNSLDDLAMSELLRCDLIVGCTDSYHGRVHLGDLATRYLVPCIDVGVLPEGSEGVITDQLIELTRHSPEDPCPYCLDKIDPGVLSTELMSPVEIQQAKKEAAEAEAAGVPGEAYWNGDVPQLPSVGYLTTCAGAMAAGYAENWLLGTAAMPHRRIQMDLGRQGLGVTHEDEVPLELCNCTKFRGHSDQGHLSITKPSHFARAIRVEELEQNRCLRSLIRRLLDWFKR
ncbi:ThiF family adenylyltransferase [Verrucomicrobiales bacterium BCK34]|nr:ThiF family adenylyltransferase [Verrucomicrobiales bacterium BCK34]